MGLVLALISHVPMLNICQAYISESAFLFT